MAGDARQLITASVLAATDRIRRATIWHRTRPAVLFAIAWENLGSLCATLWSSGIVDREEADDGRQAGCAGAPGLR